MRYEITTLKDIFDKVPADRIKACLHELAIAMEQTKAMRDLLNAAGNAIHEDSGDIDFVWPEKTTWVDDGKGEIDLKFTDSTGTELFGYDVRLDAPSGKNVADQLSAERGRYLGSMYVARRQCGKVSAMCWDGPDSKESAAQHVAEYRLRGDRVELVERYENDPKPEWICQSGCTCCEAPLSGAHPSAHPSTNRENPTNDL